jgi:diguanylate cyclase (GGDEF)-like protein
LFDQRLAEAVAAAAEGRPCALLLADLDGFKSINDQFGHLAGDAVLQEVGRRLDVTVRAADLAARFGGDEFAIVMSDLTDPAVAEKVAKRISDRVRAPLQIGSDLIVPQLSIGVAHCPLDALDTRGLLHAADQALYKAKRHGRGRTVVAGQTVLAANGAAASPAVTLTDGRAMEKALRQAVETNALSLVFQPYFLCQSRQVRGYEALLRWTHPQQGVIAPSVFLPLAEASGLIANIDAWVVRTACKMAAAWPGNATLAVNMSAHWFSRGGAVQLVREALAASHLDPARLELELTERTLISSRDVACQQMEGLRRNGVRLAMDDFGVGYSSLAYLRQFPFDKVKLDRAFIAALGEDAKADAVAKAIIQLGHALGMLVCGEGVETADQFAFLAREGCDLAQGYYLGRPADEPLSAVSHCAAVAA